MEDKVMLARLVDLVASQGVKEKLSQRNEKLKHVLLLLAKGAAIATVIASPPMAKVLRKIDWNKSDRDEWQMFNPSYLLRTIRNLERQKIIEVREKEGIGEVQLTEKGNKRVLRFGLESLRISKPSRWDKKWRLVFYDVFDGKKALRERFRGYLRGAGFYRLQESVYLHAYPCEWEVEFLKYFLGISGEVRIVIAEKIENDEEFKTYFGL